MFSVIIKEDRDVKKNSEMGKSRGSGEKLKGWERPRSNIHKDAKNCIIMDMRKGSGKKKGKDQGYLGERDCWRG